MICYLKALVHAQTNITLKQSLNLLLYNFIGSQGLLLAPDAILSVNYFVFQRLFLNKHTYIKYILKPLKVD